MKGLWEDRCVCFYNSCSAESALGWETQNNEAGRPSGHQGQLYLGTWRFWKVVEKNREARPLAPGQLHLTSLAFSEAAQSNSGHRPWLESAEVGRTGLSRPWSQQTPPSNRDLAGLGHQGKVSRACHGDEAAILVGKGIHPWRRYHTEERPEPRERKKKC